jgi:hypothetical protein
MTKCPECGRDGRHTIHCPRGRCQRCGRAPATIQGWCSFCWRAVMKERRAVVAERLAGMDGENES